MLTFHNDQSIKDKYVNRVKAHAEADELIQGQYWENGKGCAVACTVHSGDHNAYETELGIPSWLARLEDRLFEQQSNQDAKEFAVNFLPAIPLGINLDRVKSKFLIYVMQSCYGNFDNKKFPKAVKVLDDCIEIYKEHLKTGILDKEKTREIRASTADASASTADGAAADADDAAAYAADATAYASASASASAAAYASTANADASAAASAAAYASAYAAAAAAAAADAADAAAYAAYSYAYAAYAAASTSISTSKYKELADKLLEYLKEGEE